MAVTIRRQVCKIFVRTVVVLHRHLNIARDKRDIFVPNKMQSGYFFAANGAAHRLMRRISAKERETRQIHTGHFN